MNIGDVAARSGLPAKTIRYYEEIGLIRPKRSGNGYRAFAPGDVKTARMFGRNFGETLRRLSAAQRAPAESVA